MAVKQFYVKKMINFLKIFGKLTAYLILLLILICSIAFFSYCVCMGLEQIYAKLKSGFSVGCQK